MALKDLLAVTGGSQKVEIDKSEEGLKPYMPEMRRLIAYWRVYPDKFIDYLCSLNPHNQFHFRYYQRLYLRIVCRHRYVYATYVRGFSKSFLAVLSLIIKAILYPGAKLGVASGVKARTSTWAAL